MQTSPPAASLAERRGARGPGREVARRQAGLNKAGIGAS